jgi:hypothetical protein
LTVVFTLVFALRNGTMPRLEMLIPFVYWGGLYVALFAGFIARSWHGVASLRGKLVPAAIRTGEMISSQAAGSTAAGLLQSAAEASSLTPDAIPSRQERGH